MIYRVCKMTDTISILLDFVFAQIIMLLLLDTSLFTQCIVDTLNKLKYYKYLFF